MDIRNPHDLICRHCAQKVKAKFMACEKYSICPPTQYVITYLFKGLIDKRE